jgi:hypothetical protein
LFAACGGSVADPPSTAGNDPSGGASSASGPPAGGSASSGSRSGGDSASGSDCAEPPTCHSGTMPYATCEGLSVPCVTVTACGITIACGPVHSVPFQFWPSDATDLVATDSGGGFAPPGPQGSTCALGEAHFTFRRAASVLSWQTCDEAASPWSLTGGQRTLSASEAATIDAAMRGLSYPTRDECGADKSVESITVTTPRGTREYLDAFYSCEHAGTYVDGLDAVFSALRALAH